MQSKTSCFNKTIFRKHVTRFWPVWAAYLAIWVLSLPVAMLSQREYLLERPASVQSIVLDATQSGVIMSFIFAVLMAMAVWSFLYSARSASGAACLPVTRKAQFTSAVLAGFLPLAGALVVTFLLTALAELSMGLLHLPSLLSWLAATLMNLLFFYGFATFCAMLTGNVIVLPAVYCVLNFTAVGVQILLDGITKFFLYGIDSIGGSWLIWFSPAAMLLSSERMDTVTAYDAARRAYMTVGYRYAGWGFDAIYAVVGVLLLLAALALLRRRRMETAGDVVAVQVLKPVFRWCMGICAGLCFANMMLYIFGMTGGEGQRVIFAVTALYLLIGAFLGWFIAEMLIRRSFRVFRGGRRIWGGWALCCVVLLAALTVTELDVFGLERRQPSEKRVEAVVLYAGGAEGTYLSSPEGIEKALELHRGIIAHKRAQDQCDQKLFFLRGRHGDVDTVNLHLSYMLKNGVQITRSYQLPHRPGETGDDAFALQELLNSPEAVRERRATEFEFTQENVSSGSVSAVMPAAECAAAAGYDDPETYVLCELAGFTRTGAAALSEAEREIELRDALENYKYMVESGYDYTAADYGDRLVRQTADGAIDWDAVWLNYTVPLSKQEAWELWSTCVVPDLAANALGRVWILRDGGYARSVCAGSVEIEARGPEREPRDYEVYYDDYGALPSTAPSAMEAGAYYSHFRTVLSADAVRTRAWFADRGLTLYTVAELPSVPER